MRLMLLTSRTTRVFKMALTVPCPLLPNHMQEGSQRTSPTLFSMVDQLGSLLNGLSIPLSFAFLFNWLGVPQNSRLNSSLGAPSRSTLVLMRQLPPGTLPSPTM